MKLAIINSAFPFGSTGKIVLNIARESISKNNEILIAYGRGTAPKEYARYCYRISNLFSILLSGLTVRLFDNEGLNNYFSTKRFLNKLDKYQPDIIWLHNIHGYYLNYKLLFKWIKKHPDIKIKWTLHDCWSFTGHCAYFTFIQCDKWKDFCHNCPQKKSYPKSFFLSLSKKNFFQKKESFCNVNNMELITPSNWLANLVKDSFLKQYPVSVSYNKIDLNIYHYRESDFRQKYNIANKFIILGVASIWEQRKGLRDFVKLSKLLDQNKFQIVLVGKLNKRKIYRTNIIHISKTSNPIELSEIYSAANIFFNPTYEDNYPTVNLEAEACKCPVLTYDTGGSSETLFLKKSLCLKTKDVFVAYEIIKEREEEYENSSN